MTRKPTKAEEIQNLKNKLETQKTILESTLKKAYALEEKRRNGTATKADEKLAKKLWEDANECVEFIRKNAPEVREFYKPAMVI